ncbi:hypothetical protein Avbf_09789 [Armadillidium vulgare]|nr:hypothetical protein Avbf_09789 [Armadillidium vulgare]
MSGPYLISILMDISFSSFDSLPLQYQKALFLFLFHSSFRWIHNNLSSVHHLLPLPLHYQMALLLLLFHSSHPWIHNNFSPVQNIL